MVGVADCIIRKLQGVQNAAAWMITGTLKFDHVTPILRELHWLPVAQRIQYMITMLVNKCLLGLAPSYLAELCRPVVHLTGRQHLRSAASGKLDVHRQPQPLVAGTLLFPVRRLGTVYHLNCVCRHCPWPPLHDAWKHISSSALNDMCLQRIWFYLRLRCLQISLLLLLL